MSAKLKDPGREAARRALKSKSVDEAMKQLAVTVERGNLRVAKTASDGKVKAGQVRRSRV